MGGVADHCLIQVPYLNGNASVKRCNRSETAGMTISANPHRRPFGQGAAFLIFEPFVEFDGTASDTVDTRYALCLPC